MLKLILRWQELKKPSSNLLPSVGLLHLSSSRLEQSSVVERQQENAAASSSKSEIELKLANLKVHYTHTHKISKSAFLTLIKLIESSKQCDPRTALFLLRSCGMHLIDLAPHKRQLYLDYMFGELFRSPHRAPVRFTLEHYDAYMSTTLVNEGSFCPFEMTRLMRVDENVQAQQQQQQQHHATTSAFVSVDTSLVKRLCQLDEIDVALARVGDVFRGGGGGANNHTSLPDLEKYKSRRRPIEFDRFVDDVLSSSTSSHSVAVDLINPLILFYLTNNEPHKAIKLFQLLVEKKLEPDSSTYVSLISGYVRMGKLDEARQLFDKSYSNFKLIDCFSLQLELLKGGFSLSF